MRQQSLPWEFEETLSTPEELMRTTFSHDGVSPQAARQELERRYMSLLEETDKFDRRLVSYQGNKQAMLHSWFKYREGFSAQLVEQLIAEFELKPGDTILEPFSGSATTLLVAKSLGVNATGIEILPVCHLAWEAKSHVYDYDLDELHRVLDLIRTSSPGRAQTRFPHIVITDTAFPDEAENDLMFYTEWFEQLDISEQAKILLRLALTSILEEISYTRKDGQYLRWDIRSEKVQSRNRNRLADGKKPIKGMNKGQLSDVKQVLLAVIRTYIDDIRRLQNKAYSPSEQKLIQGSVLEILPTLEADQFAAVITSPPYCNRYDYTRTYALELAYLGAGEDGIRQLRFDQLSCTVEHRSKADVLREHYRSIGQESRFGQILGIIQANPVFNEINQALAIRWERGEINNQGILPMVEGYFTELAFVFAEIFRTSRNGAHVAFVNDNVRYGGEIIPVDLFSTDLAVQLGFEPVKVYVLPQRKGNSSQQMGRFGREALRKSITIWKKL